MKVIKNGSLPEDKVYTATCLHCKSELEFKRSEAQFESTCRNEDYLKVKCPVCTREVWLQI